MLIGQSNGVLSWCSLFWNGSSLCWVDIKTSQHRGSVSECPHVCQSPGSCSVWHLPLSLPCSLWPAYQPCFFSPHLVLLSFRAAAVMSLFLLVGIFVAWWAKWLPFVNLILELRTRYDWWRTQVSSLQFIGCIIFCQLFCFLCSALRSFCLSSQKLHCQFTQLPELVPCTCSHFSFLCLSDAVPHPPTSYTALPLPQSALPLFLRSPSPVLSFPQNPTVFPCVSQRCLYKSSLMQPYLQP